MSVRYKMLACYKSDHCADWRKAETWWIVARKMSSVVCEHCRYCSPHMLGTGLAQAQTGQIEMLCSVRPVPKGSSIDTVDCFVNYFLRSWSVLLSHVTII